MDHKYLRMIRSMEKRAQNNRRGSRRKKEWSVYVLRCGDGSLYTGIAKDISARLVLHQKGRGAAYTRTHLPVELVYKEAAFTRSGALIREARLKRLSRPQKERLLVGA